MTSNAFGRYATAGFVLASIATSYFFGRRRSKNFVGTRLNLSQQLELDRNLTTPANGTFAIAWPLIYTGTAGLAIHQALDSQADNPRYAQARPWLWASYALNAVFGYFFVRPGKEARQAAALITLGDLVSAIPLHRSLEIGHTDVPQPERTWRAAASLYLGWLTAAGVVSAVNLLQQNGIATRKRERLALAYALLPATAGAGLALSRRLNDPILLSTLSLALGGIAYKQIPRNPSVGYLAAGLGLILAADMVRRLPAAWQDPEPDLDLSQEPRAYAPTAQPADVVNQPLDLKLAEHQGLEGEL